VLATFLGSQEYFLRHGGINSTWLDGVYQDILGRKPDAAGKNAWLQQMAVGLDRTTLALQFASSAEHEALVVSANYQQLLGRQASAAELNGWVQAAQAGTPDEQIMTAFLASPEFFQ